MALKKTSKYLKKGEGPPKLGEKMEFDDTLMGRSTQKKEITKMKQSFVKFKSKLEQYKKPFTLQQYRKMIDKDIAALDPTLRYCYTYRYINQLLNK